MKKLFKEPSLELVKFNKSIITESGDCNCFDGTTDYGSDEECPNANDPQCTCKLNMDPALGNCV